MEIWFRTKLKLFKHPNHKKHATFKGHEKKTEGKGGGRASFYSLNTVSIFGSPTKISSRFFCDWTTRVLFRKED